MALTGQSLVTMADGLPDNSLGTDFTLSNIMNKQNLLKPALSWNNTNKQFDYNPDFAQTSTNTQKGLFEQLLSSLGITPEAAKTFGNFGQGIGGLASIGTGIYNAFMQNKAFNLQKDAMKQAMQFNAENQARQRHEWARQDQNRASISASWNGR